MTGLDVVTPVEERALAALGTYRFLTVALMQRAEVARDPKAVRAGLAVLRRRGWVERTKVQPFKPGTGRLPHLYWLRPAGADALAELRGMAPPEAIRGTVTAVDELPHRIAIIETHMASRAWAGAHGASLDWFRGDYEPGSDRLQKATALPHGAGRYTPDAVAQVTLPDGKARLLVFEVYRGGRKASLDHFRRKLPELRAVAEAGAVEAHHSSTRAARFLVIFTDDTMRAGALHGWGDPAAPVWERFFVKSMGELEPSFSAGWHHPKGGIRPLF